MSATVKQKDLTDAQIDSIVSVLKPYYHPDFRDELVYHFLGLLKNSGISYESAKKVVERLVKVTLDKEADRRLYLVDYLYGKAERPPWIEKIRVYFGFRDLLEKIIKTEYSNKPNANEWAIYSALKVTDQLEKILYYYAFLEKHLVLVPIKTGTNIEQFYVNDTLRGIYVLTKKNDIITINYVLGLYLENVTIHKKSDNLTDIEYVIRFNHPTGGSPFEFKGSTIDQIVREVKSKVFGVRNPRRLKAIISSLIEGFYIKGITEIE